MGLWRVKKEQIRVILGVTFGNILEWFEIYLYAYWAPVLSKVFFNFDSDLANLISTFVIFGAGFLARPFGAIVFGRLGDKIGRKNSFTLSITLLTIPTFIIGMLPTYAEIGIFAPILLGLMRLLQSFPAAGEAPGAFCYLYEYADEGNKRFMTSWGGFGNQIGAILSLIECYLMELFMSEEFAVTWGWRISFLTGGLIGLLGIFLRHKMHETPMFKKIVEKHEINKAALGRVINHYKRGILLGTAYGAVNAATFYLIASYIPAHFNTMLGLSDFQNAMVTLSILLLTTVLLPFFGMLGDRFSNKSILIVCTVFIIMLLYPLFLAVSSMNLLALAIMGFLFIIPVTCITALIPYLLTNLFPTPVRFTCVGLSFNLADGIIGGFTPAIALFLIQATGHPAAFCWLILLCGTISMVSYFRIKESRLRQ